MSAAEVHNVPATLADLLVPIDQLSPYEHNARRGNVDVIAESLTVNGQYRPVVANVRTGEVLAGNHTLQAGLKLGWTHLAVSWVDVDPEAAARIVLIDNRANDLAGYDDDALAALLQELPGLEGTGYTDADLEALVADDEPVARTDPDEPPPVPKGKPISELGDVWLLGKHRLLVGDSTDAGAVLDMLGGDRPDCVWTDPPYGVSYVGGTKDALTIENDGKDDLPELLPAAFRTAAAAARPGAPIYVAHADTERIVFEESMLAAGLLVRQNLIWVKSSIVMGRSDYHYKHEPILEGEAPAAPAEDDGEGIEVVTTHEPLLYGFTGGGKGRLGRGGERWHGDNKQSTVFEVPKPTRNGEHPTMKPIELILKMLRNSCPVGGLVLDLFGGSGSTMIAAHHYRARSALVELDPRYADVICRRWQEHTGILPINARTGDLVDFTVEAA